MSNLSEKQIEDSKNYPSLVYLSSKVNSTLFTTCCHVAITDSELQCPSCKRFVYGWDSSNRGRTRWNFAYTRKAK